MTQSREWSVVETLFHGALALAPEAREDWLREVTGGDAAVVAEVLALLAADAAATPGLVSAVAHDALAALTPVPATGRQVGPYRLVREVGQGGMGAVFLAERTDEAYHAQVAIKFVRGGVTGAELLRRLVAERQILADLAHPNIARLLDGGTTEDGVPYLVLEYIDGAPVDQHCAGLALGLRERLALFLRICEAVQHAHQALVIHRDLKPSNILVTRDGTPKLVDFGIAKVLADPDSAATQTGLLAMTPAYASPEQVRGARVTVATDVYSLGVVLYQLVTGVLPLPIPPGTSLPELLRRVQEVEPARASAAATAPWREALRGDLDAILQRALAKEPERRYPSVEQLAADLHRHLRGEPVQARPATATYRLGRWVRRNRALSAVALVAVLALVTGLTVALWQRDRAERARQRTAAALAQSNATRDFLLDLFRANDPVVAQGRELTARDLLDRGTAQVDELGDQPALQAELLHVLGRLQLSLSEYRRGADLLHRSIRVHRAAGSPDSVLVDVFAALGNAMHDLGWPDSAAQAWQTSVDLGVASLGPDNAAVLGSMGNLGIAYSRLGQVARAESTYRRLIAAERRVLGPDHVDRAYALNNLGLLLTNQGRFAEAEPVLREEMELMAAAWADTVPAVAFGYDNYGVMLREAGRYAEAEPVLRKGLAIRLHLLGPEHRFTGESYHSLGKLLAERGRPEDLAEADSLLRLTLAVYRKRLDPGHPAVAYALFSMGELATARGNLPEAERWFRQALALRQQATARDDPAVRVHTLVALGHTLRAEGKAEAGAVFQRADSVARARLDPGHPARREAAIGLLLGRAGAGDSLGPAFADEVSQLAARVGREHPAVTRACRLGIAVRLSAPGTCP